MIDSLFSLFMHRVFLLIMHVLLLAMRCGAKKNHLCPASSCGEIHNISYPFRLKDDPKGCGRSNYELACENNRTVLYLHAGRYYVKSISYGSYDDEDNFVGDITVVDDGLQKGNCSSLPRYSLSITNFSGHDVYTPLPRLVVLVKCSLPVVSTLYVDTKPCIEGAYSVSTPPNLSQAKVYSYYLHGNGMKELTAQDIRDSCTVTMTAFASVEGLFWGRDTVRGSYKEFHSVMAEGFDLSYMEFNPPRETARFCFLGFTYRRQRCSYYKSSKRLSLELFFLALSISSSSSTSFS